MKPRLTESEMRAWQALLHTHHLLIGQLDGELKQVHGISLNEYDVLLRLARVKNRTLRMSELASRILFSPSGLTRVVDRLVRQHLVARQRDDVDARVIFASLTTEGLSKIRAASKSHLCGIREHFTGKLSEKQLKSIASALEMICGPHQEH